MVSTCFAYVDQQIYGLSKEKIKVDIFDGLQIKQIVKDLNFVKSINDKELKACNHLYT